MVFDITNWKTQIRKGYLELCLLSLIGSKQRLYGFEILDLLKTMALDVKEGTLYPLLNRMTTDGLLSSVWETNSLSGHPRKFYSLSVKGNKMAEEMQEEFFKLIEIVKDLNK